MGNALKAEGSARRSLLGLYIAAGALLCLLAARAAWLAPSFRLWGSFLTLMILPGAAVAFSRAGRGLDVWERICASFIGSLIVLVAAGLISNAAGWGLTGVVRLIPAVTFAASLLQWRMGGERADREGDAGAESPEGRSSPSGQVLILAFVAVVLVLSSAVSGEMTPGSDAFDHIATVREIRDTGELFPLSASYKYPEAPLPDPRKGLFHAGLAAMSVYSGQDPVRVWTFLPKALLPLTLLVVLCLGRGLTGSTAGGLVSAVFWAGCFGGAGSRLPTQVGYAHNVSEIASWVLILMILKYAVAGRKTMAVFSAVGLAACCFIHVSAIVLAMAAWGCFVAAVLVLGGGSRRLVGARLGRAGLLWLVLGVPAATAKVLMSYAPANPIQLQNQNLLYLASNLYVVNPMWVYSWLGPPGLLSIALAVWFAFRGRRAPGTLYLVGASILPMAVVMNPLLVPVFYSVVGYLVERFTWVVPYPYLLAYTVVLSARRLRAAGPPVPRLGSAAVAVVVIAAVSGTALSRASKGLPEAVTYKEWLPALDYLRDDVKEPSVVASDMLTSYSIPAFTKHHIVSTLHQHGSPNDPSGVDRILALIEIMNPDADPSVLRRKLLDEEVDFILVNRTFKRRQRLYFSEIDPAVLKRLDRRLAGRSGLFREVFRAEGLSIYSVSRRALEAWQPGPAPPPPYVLGPGRNPRGKPVETTFEGEIELLSADLASASVERGGELGITCYWRGAVARPDFDLPWVVQVRIETDYPKGRFYSASYSKIYRKALELITGRRYRWRQSHLPASGVFPPPLWHDSVVVDRAALPIPGWMRPGAYQVSVSIGREPVYPTYTLRDFLRDEDRYSGVVVGTIEVK
jgi:hypothetical protein